MRTLSIGPGLFPGRSIAEDACAGPPSCAMTSAALRGRSPRLSQYWIARSERPVAERISATVARPLSRSVRSFSITCSNSDPTSTYSRYGSSARRSKTHFFLFESTAFLADEADGAGANLFRAYEADGSSTDRRPVRRGRFRIGMEAVVGHDVAIRPDADLSGLAVPPRRQSHSAAVPTISPRKRQPLGRLAAERRDGREAVCVDSRRRGDEWVGVREEEEVGGFDPIPVAATTVDAFVGIEGAPAVDRASARRHQVEPGRFVGS